MSDEANTNGIDVTSQEDQEFMDMDAEPQSFDPQEHYEQLVDKFEEKGWDTSRLVDPSAEKAKSDSFDFERVDDLLKEAHEKTVQWKASESNPDLSKAPGVWDTQDDIPDFVLDTLKRMINSGNVVWSGGYDKLPPGSEAAVISVLEQKMTQPQGWSLDSLLADLKDELGHPFVKDSYLLGILRNETSAVLNTAREEAYEERDDSEEYVYDWIGPTDHRTTDTCLSIEDRIEDEGGAVPMPQLKEILYEEAIAHSDAEGTPDRVSDWQPHYQCRRTFTRKVQSL